MRAVFDTNILIDFLNANKKAEKELKKYKYPCISIITWMEILVRAKNKEELLLLEQTLKYFDVYQLTEAIARKAVEIRRAYNIKLPDAIIWATAQTENLILVTRNVRDFSSKEPTIRIPYQL